VDPKDAVGLGENFHQSREAMAKIGFLIGRTSFYKKPGRTTILPECG